MSSAVAALYPWDTFLLLCGIYAGILLVGLLACAISDWWHG